MAPMPLEDFCVQLGVLALSARDDVSSYLTFEAIKRLRARLRALGAALPCRCGQPMDQVTATRDPSRSLGFGCITLGCSRHVA